MIVKSLISIESCSFIPVSINVRFNKDSSEKMIFSDNSSLSSSKLCFSLILLETFVSICLTESLRLSQSCIELTSDIWSFNSIIEFISSIISDLRTSMFDSVVLKSSSNLSCLALAISGTEGIKGL